MTEPFNARRSERPYDQNHTLVAVIELSLTRWLVGSIVPGLERRRLKRLKPDKGIVTLSAWRGAGRLGSLSA